MGQSLLISVGANLKFLPSCKIICPFGQNICVKTKFHTWNTKVTHLASSTLFLGLKFCRRTNVVFHDLRNRNAPTAPLHAPDLLVVAFVPCSPTCPLVKWVYRYIITYTRVCVCAYICTHIYDIILSDLTYF